MKIYIVQLVVFFSLVVFYGCNVNGNGVNNRDKHNENIPWQFDSKKNTVERLPADDKMPGYMARFFGVFLLSHFASTSLVASKRLLKYGGRTNFLRCFIKRIAFPFTFLISISITVVYMFTWIILHQ